MSGGIAGGSLPRLGGGGLTVTGDVFGIAFSPDGKTFATAAESGGMYITVWDAHTGQPRGTLKTDAGAYGMSYSADGKTLLSGRRQINVETGQSEMLTNSYVRAVSPDGELIAGQDAAKNSIVVWKTGGAGNLWSGPVAETGRVIAVEFSPHHKRLAATLDDGRVSLLNATTGKRLAELKAAERGSTTRPVFSPDGKRLAIPAMARTVNVFDAATGELVSKLTAPSGGGFPGVVAFSPDGGRLASAARPGNRILLWDLESEQVIKTIDSNYQQITSLAISPDGKRLAAGGKGAMLTRLQVWELDPLNELYLPRGAHSTILHVAFAPNSRRLATGSEAGRVHLWDVRNPEPLLELSGDSSGDLQFTADGWRLAAAGRGGALRVWETDSGDEVYSREGNRSVSQTFACIASAGELVVLGKEYHQFTLADLTTGEKLRTFEPAEKAYTKAWALAMSANGKWLASVPRIDQREKIGVQLWHTDTGKPGRRFPFERVDDRQAPGARVAVKQVALSPTGDLLAAANEESGLHVWETSSGYRLLRTPGIARFCFSPHGRYLLAQTGNKLKLLELATGEVCFEAHQDSAVTALAMSPDGRLAACATAPANAVELVSLAPNEDDVAKTPTADEIAWSWKGLLASDPQLAYRAVWMLSAGGDASVELLGSELKPLLETELDEALVQQLIADLDSDQFDVRERAATEIVRIGPAALHYLHQAQEEPRSTEHKFRLERLVLSMERATRRFAGEPLRRLRAIGVLEQIGTRAAGEVLEQVAQGAPSARETLEAQAALARLKIRLRGP